MEIVDKHGQIYKVERFPSRSHVLYQVLDDARLVARATYDPRNLCVTDVLVQDPADRRKGIASALYDAIELETGDRLRPSAKTNAVVEGLWGERRSWASGFKQGVRPVRVIPGEGDLPAKVPRLDDWWPRLEKTVRQYDGLPFVWGYTDCAMFAAACVEAVTGVDVGSSWRGTYDTRLGSTAQMLHRNFRTVQDAAHKELHRIGALRRDDVHSCQPGDIGITMDDILAVRMPHGFVARTEPGGFNTSDDYRVVRPIRAWAI